MSPGLSRFQVQPPPEPWQYAAEELVLGGGAETEVGVAPLPGPVEPGPRQLRIGYERSTKPDYGTIVGRKHLPLDEVVAEPLHPLIRAVARRVQGPGPVLLHDVRLVLKDAPHEVDVRHIVIITRSEEIQFVDLLPELHVVPQAITQFK